MKILGAFREFAKRVLKAVKKGGLPRIDQMMLDRLLIRTEKRNLILAKGILTTLDAGGATKKDISHLGELLEKAQHRILADKEPFTDRERKDLAAIFRRASVPKKTTRRFTQITDELLAAQINETIKGKRKMTLGIPKKKTLRLKRKKEQKRLKA